MKREWHCRPVTRIRGVAQASNYIVKLESTTQIIDRLLLVPRQAPWKSTGPSGEGGTDTITDTGVDTTVEI
ncbi:MAG: hypothetical protein KA184_20985 [Candidatus Hydrogenedentes bacterium]|nr:hypothetical protein [Candidatus Hydrogenedentota bacterium]